MLPSKTAVGGCSSKLDIESLAPLAACLIFFLLVYGLVVAHAGSSAKLAVNIMGCALVAFLAFALIYLPTAALKDLGRVMPHEAYDQRGAPPDKASPCAARATYRVVVLCALIAAVSIGAILYATSDINAACFVVVTMVFILASLPAVMLLLSDDDTVARKNGRVDAAYTLVKDNQKTPSSPGCEPSPTTVVSESRIDAEGAAVATSRDDCQKIHAQVSFA
ncbi:hypothetical protein ACIS_00765 [Anaplasma centrale str. Israel]|uniref:Uncharacterized protein n=1 Tax=Anaplasma centrale (strain Israel) TaxID=574556 RepID=D1AS65_ANACI|nr:hypothetical protein [Anaplasma centrale]ACZ49318.1 hypothetical protein ACIS_00765 [Anaplasma centrale str. Israel]